MAEQNKEMVQQLVVMYQLIQSHREQLQQQLAALQKSFADVDATKQAVEALGKKADQDVLIPLGAGVFSRGSATETGTMLIDVGAGVVVEKAPAAIAELIDKKKVELEKLFGQLQLEEAQAAQQINEIAQQIQQLSG